VESRSPVLVTGAFGLVGGEVVRQLAASGHHVVATDLEVPPNRKAAGALGDAIKVRWADLTQPGEVDRLVTETNPGAIVHLAAIIPPLCYANRSLARAVNVDATASLIRAAEAQSIPPRFVQASSIAVYGARNPHHHQGDLTVDTPLRPSDIYGAHKVEAERGVRTSKLHWLILRLGGVLPVEPRLGAVTLETIYFEASLPADGRIQTVDVRDVARAFCTAVDVDISHEIFLIGGDASNRLQQRDIPGSMAAAVGLRGAIPPGRPGDPNSDDGWFATDWMDTCHSQLILKFQQHSFSDSLAYTRRRARRARWLLRSITPLVRRFLQRRSPYFRAPGVYADPWSVIRATWGESEPETDQDKPPPPTFDHSD
jgi:D-erythronate 2-dehydrogenase